MVELGGLEGMLLVVGRDWWVEEIGAWMWWTEDADFDGDSDGVSWG